MGGLGYLDCGTLYNVKFTHKKQSLLTVFALAVMEYAVSVSKFGKNPMTL